MGIGVTDGVGMVEGLRLYGTFIFVTRKFLMRLLAELKSNSMCRLRSACLYESAEHALSHLPFVKAQTFCVVPRQISRASPFRVLP